MRGIRRWMPHSSSWVSDLPVTVTAACTSSETTAIVMLLLVYVDDLLLVTNDTAQLAATKAALSSRFDMKDMGEAHFILGVQVRRDRASRQLCLSQAEYVRTMLERFGMQDCKPAASPMATGNKLLKTDCTTDTTEESMDNIPYASAVGALMYAALVTRPDIAYAVTAHCVSLWSNPSIAHWQSAKRVFRYLQGTRHHELTYGLALAETSDLCTDTVTRTGATTSIDRQLVHWVGISCCTTERSAGSRASN